MTEAYFHAAHKGVNRKAHGEHFLFELMNNSRKAVSAEEANRYDLQWLSMEELRTVRLQHAEADMLLERIRVGSSVYVGDGVLANSGEFTGMDFEKAKWEITKLVGGERKTQYRLRDWLISRQRYWGPPIPMIHCDTCATAGKSDAPSFAKATEGTAGWYAAPEKDLPV